MALRNSDGVRLDRTGWRCQDISERHRHWGYNCPAVDLDFMVAEYNYGKPVALIEYKEQRAKISTDHTTYHALRSLADGYSGGSLPFLIAIYSSEHWWFRIIPMNDSAKKFYPPNARNLTEKRFVKSLYVMREITLSESDSAAIERLNTVYPPMTSVDI